MGLFNKSKQSKSDELEKAIENAMQQADLIKQQINIEAYSAFVVIEFLAREFAKCKFNFCYKNEVKYNEEYYRWNIRPNEFQTGAEFKKELMSKLLAYNEVLIIETTKKDLIVADSYSVKQFGTGPYIFTDVQKGDERFISPFTQGNNAIFLTYSNGEVDIKRRLAQLVGALENIASTAADNYARSNAKKGIVEIGALATGKKDIEKKIENLFNNQFRQFFLSKRDTVLPLYEGMTYRDLNDDRSSVKKSEITDIQSLIKEAVSKTAVGYGVHPTLVLGDVANTTEAERLTTSKAIKPIAEMIENAITEAIFGVTGFVNDNYAKLDLAPLQINTVFENAEASDKLLASGQYSIDDLREARGDRRLNTWWSQMHFMTKNYECIDNILNQSEGGGKYGKTE